MSLAAMTSPLCIAGVYSQANRKQNQSHNINAKKKKISEKIQIVNGSSSIGFKGKKEDPIWKCVAGCGSCCKLDKGPSFATPEEIFQDQSDIELYKTLIGPDGWCKHYEKTTRTCTIYEERPYFCRVEPEVFEDLYGISEKRFNRDACSSCRDTIKSVYGAQSEELQRFNDAIRNSSISK
ncbi:uncharacterized protein LOC124940151 [Impatiens glandulifera]|uniref:uncharacterized protein LOC124940151 n=1 Tax=Impatiens glandulifera TaxID=253017 RepID=UPI001FB08F7E|nr:uncharacterized protein LOC124940151 [Impatiens glandulifera]